MARPTNVDSQRIVTLMDEVISKARILAWLTEENLAQVESSKSDLENIMDPELLVVLLNHFTLLTGFNGYNTDEDTGYIKDEFDEESENIANHLSKSTNDLVRYFARDPDSLRYLTESFGDTKSPAILEIVNILVNLRKLSITKLMTPLDEELSREKEIQAISEKLEKTQQDEKNWEKQLHAVKKERNNAKQQRQSEINSLKEELLQVLADTKQRSAILADKSDRQTRNDAEAHYEKIDQLQQEAESLEKEVEELENDNRDKESVLRDGRRKLQTQKLVDKIEFYDSEMKSKKETYQKRMEKYQLEKARLESFEERDRQLQEEKQRIENEEASALSRKNVYDKHIQDLNNAVEYVQAHYRGLKTRAQYEKDKRALRRGRRGGKKGKKK